MALVNAIATRILRRRFTRIQQFMDQPDEIQAQVFRMLLDRGTRTKFGQDHHFRDIQNVREFRERVPLRTYEEFFPYIERTLRGEQDVVWPGETLWFSKSSGTTNDRRKLIPVSRESLNDNHYAAGRDMLAIYFQNRPDSKMFRGKALGITGNNIQSEYNPKSYYGDISAILLENMPLFFQFFSVPSKEVALMDEWEEKINLMAREAMDENITSLAGVPTWIWVLFNRIFDLKGNSERNILDIWPNLEIFFHGGVSFEPYRDQFSRIVPSDHMQYYNVYNASEGFFGVQLYPDRSDMLLLLDLGIYYEFIPMEEMEKEHPHAVGIEEVELGKTYTMAITTNGGLWRYIPGDTIKFTSLSPPLIQITGRTKHFINAFGEELIVENAEEAVTQACKETGAVVLNYTAGPVYFAGSNQGAHEWLFEFERPPDSLDQFKQTLDRRLREVNQDYAAKRYKDMALSLPLVRELPEGTFYRWLKEGERLGAQQKVPRLSNNRKYIEEILALVPTETT
ncbi:MAG: GH3 auxin-responsive promoter family protein [Bacteroidia bacterium]|nr:GH3 auxin-responsive promoter family protein [Bacteroidia bacterium]